MAHWSHSFESENYERTLRRWLEASEHAWFVSPFVTRPALTILSEAAAANTDIRLITRFHEEDVLSGLSDLSALADYIEAGGKVRFDDHSLHAKLWVFDKAAFVGSVNLTGAALSGNREAMAQLDPATSQPGVTAFFRDLWERLEPTSRSPAELRSEADRLRVHPLAHRFNIVPGLRDLGGTGVTETARSSQPRRTSPGADTTTWFKINGRSDDRINDDFDLRSLAVELGGETVSSGRGRPRLKPGDPVILSRLGFHNNANDYCIYGRGVVDIEHREGIDELQDWIEPLLLDPAKREDLRRWPYIFWLRDVQIADVLARDSVWLSDINRNGQVLRPISLARQSYISLDDLQLTAFNAALDCLFLRVPPIVRERPEYIWWNQFLPPEHHLNRTRLENEARSRGRQVD